MGKTFSTVPVDTVVCSGATCDQCGKVLEPVMQDQNGKCYAFDGALYLKAYGSGYAEFMDGDPAMKGVLCENCAREFLKLYPFMRTPPEPMYDLSQEELDQLSHKNEVEKAF